MMAKVRYTLLRDSGVLSSDSGDEETLMLNTRNSKPNPKQLQLNDYDVSRRRSKMGGCAKCWIVVMVIVVMSLVIAGALMYSGNLKPLIHHLLNISSSSHSNTNSTSTIISNTTSGDNITLSNNGRLPPPPHRSYNKSSDPAQYADWENQLMYTGSESPLRVYDVNTDGVLDILVGLTFSMKRRTSEPEQCKLYKKNGGCGGGISAFDGRTGSVIWTIYTKDEVYELTCVDIDLDNDGVFDCVASGRYGTFLAFSPVNAKIIWSMPDGVNQNWNVFAPGFIHDVSGDGVRDMIVINGGDTQYSPQEHDRVGSVVLVVNSVTGEVIGRPFPVPDMRESYTLPIIYTWSDNSQYIIFGSGGETVSGSSFVISLSDLLHYVSPGEVFDLIGGYDHWKNRPRDENGVITLYKTKTKGVMVPALMADLNNDNTDDIIVMTFDGVLLAFDGSDLSYLWSPMNFTVDIPTESYAFPAFGYFNDDDILDIMVSWQTGSWPAYDSLMIFILNGADGSILWFKDTPVSYDYSVVPPLILNTEHKYRDAFVFRMSSTNMPFENDKDIPVSGLSDRSDDRSDDRSKRHIGMHSNTNLLTCDDIDMSFVDTFIMDRDNMNAPLQLYRQHSEAYHYNVSQSMINHYKMLEVMNGKGSGGFHMTGPKRRHADHSYHADGDDDDDDDDDDADEFDADSMLNTQRCERFNDRDSSAGIITDLEGDGILDYVTADVAFAQLRIHNNDENPQTILKFTIRKFTLQNIYQKLPSVHLAEVLTRFNSSERQPLTQLKLAGLHNQMWPQHMGRQQNGRY